MMIRPMYTSGMDPMPVEMYELMRDYIEAIPASEQQTRASVKAGEVSAILGREILALEAERDQLRAELAAARERIKKLEQVEWIYSGYEDYCPWCGNDRVRDHAPDCPRKEG